MGRLSAMAMIESCRDPRVSLRLHLESNHYPPVRGEWILCCMWAIDRAIAGQDLNVLAPVPSGYAPQLASTIIEGLHLEPWLQNRNNGPT